jgi:hypothetical protein
MKKISFLLFLCFTGFLTLAQQFQISRPSVKRPVYFDVSPPLRDMAFLNKVKPDISWKDGVVRNNFNSRRIDSQIPAAGFRDVSVQSQFGPLQTDTTIENFEGVGGGSYIPPDTYGDVGPNHYFQVVNCSYAVYNKSGTILLGPIGSGSVWNGMPNNTNSGDAVVVYDENADRWLFTQFSLPNFPAGPFYQMIAVSQTPDPTGSWYRYQYLFSDMPDYPKFGVWTDGYYMSCNRFSAGNTYYVGTGAAAFDRTRMLAGDPNAQMIWFTLSGSNEAFGMLPSDCDGPFPPAGTPAYFTYEYSGSPNHLGILEFQADFEAPANSTFGNLLSLPVNAFNSNLGPGIPQKGTNVTLATLSDRLMYRAQFRKFNDHWSMLCNHTVNAGNNIAGVRWYELRKTTGAWTIYQQSTYAPSDNNCRWMGSMAMDTAGDIALGYSVSGNNLYPSIRYTGRLKSDQLNQMTIAEHSIFEGGGCQTSSTQRWGDYSTMTVDPASPTTFWYSSEYYSITSSSNWQTRVGSFTFGNVFSSFATSNPATICIGDSSHLSAVAYGGSGNYTYSWTSIPSGFTSTMKSPVVSPSDTTKYIVAVSDGSTTKHDTTRVAIAFFPTVFAGNDTTVCSTATSVLLKGTATNYTNIAWASSGDGTFSSHSSLSTIYTFGTHDRQVDSVDLYLFAFGFNPCGGRVSSMKKVTISPCDGISENPAIDQEVTLLPNPAKESVTIIVTGLRNSSALLTMKDSKGQTLFSEDLQPSAAQAKEQLDLQHYPSGIYFIIVRTNSKVITKRLVVER